MRLYPRLRLVAANRLARDLAGIGVEDAMAASTHSHPDASPAPTGGQAATLAELTAVARAVRAEATRAGYPKRPALVAQREFDARTGRLLLHQMDLGASEAAHTEVWAFLGCVLMPDVVRWRFGAGDTSAERFVGGARGIRNTFGRLWWRAYLLESRTMSGETVDPLVELNEDELVQITERPGLSGFPPLASALAHTFISVLPLSPEVPREELMRQATKRLLRMLALVSPESMELHEVQALVSESIDAACRALMAGPVEPRLGPAVRPLKMPAPEPTTTPPASPPVRAAAPPAPPQSSRPPSHVEHAPSARIDAMDRSAIERKAPRDNPQTLRGSEEDRTGPAKPADALAATLRDKNLEVIDRRDRGGRLWVVGGTELELMLASLAPAPGRFILARNGSTSTGRRPGWYLHPGA